MAAPEFICSNKDAVLQDYCELGMFGGKIFHVLIFQVKLFVDNHYYLYRETLVSIRFGDLAPKWYWRNLNLAIWMLCVICMRVHTLSIFWRILNLAIFKKFANRQSFPYTLYIL